MTLLSCLRLAPVQCTTSGHPITSGSPNMDFFLSSALMEPPAGDSHYSERLIRLPGIGVCYSKPVIPRAILDRRRSRFGLRDGSTVYLCCQSTFKYIPDHDDVFARIAQRVPDAQFVFLTRNSAQGEVFRKRLGREFTKAGLNPERHCVLLPMSGTFDYWALNLASDIFLDSLGWSGFNTTLEAIACGLPVVTLPGAFMRGRHTFAILTQLDVSETIAKNKEEYVDIAVRLGHDPDWRKEVVERMSEREARLYSDKSSVIALEQFLTDATLRSFV
jgi:protein O-GlcNAc transferase